MEMIMDERRLLPFIYHLKYFPTRTLGYRYPHPKTSVTSYVTKSPQRTTRNDINEVMLRESILGFFMSLENTFVQQPEELCELLSVCSIFPYEN